MVRAYQAPGSPGTTGGEKLRLTLRVLMEVGIVASLALWGARTGGTTAIRVLLAITAPAAGFGFWAVIDFRRAGRLAEPLRLIQELCVSGAAAVAAYVAGARLLGVALAAVSVAYHTLVYAAGRRLLESPRGHHEARSA